MCFMGSHHRNYFKREEGIFGMSCCVLMSSFPLQLWDLCGTRQTVSVLLYTGMCLSCKLNRCTLWVLFFHCSGLP